MGSSEGPGSNMCCMKYWDNISKPPNDDRIYRAIELKNGMKILLISDPETEKSAAAVDVKVGSLSDPVGLPGLAHFCEHMLLLGTAKYPDPNDFTRYITMHGGRHNASTFSDHTVYYFDINSNFLRGALDRFAHFFISPLFTEECTEREVQSIHKEFENNYAVDIWRLDQFDKHTSKPGHPYAKFANGTIDTLINIPREKGINVREELKRFHSKWYSSNIMTAAIIGKDDVNELERLATILFGHVKNRNAEHLEWNDPPFGFQQSRVIGYVVPKQNIKTLSISFPAPDYEVYYRTKPYHYISSLFGHEGSGSLLAALKKRGWSENLISGAKIGAKGFGFFYVKLDLTDEGIKNVYNIVKLFFQYVKMLNSEGPQKWFFDEYRIMFDASYRFKEKELPVSYVTTLAKHLHQFPVEDVIKAPYVADRWDPYVIQTLMRLVVPARVRLAVVAQKFETIADQNEPWFGTKYKLENIPYENIQEWENCERHPEFALPERNCFIPSNLEMMPVEEGPPHPVILQENSLMRFWYKQDVTFRLPKANLLVDFYAPFAYIDPFNCSLARLFTHLVEGTLYNVTYAAELAGQEWDIKNTEYGISISIEGYNDKQHLLLDSILAAMMSLKISPEQFEIVKQNYIKSLVYFDNQQPSDQTTYYLGVLISDYAWTKNELMEAAEDLTLKHLTEFIPQLFSKFFVECLVCGNTTKEKARQLVTILEDRLETLRTARPLIPHLRLRRREIKFPDGCNFIYEVPNKYHKSSCTEVYFQCTTQSIQNNMLLELLVQLMAQPAVAALKNGEKAGCRVFCGVRRSSCVQGLRIVLQSVEHPLYLEQRISTFLMTMRENLVNVDEPKFETLKEALTKTVLQKPKTLTSVTLKYWKEISLQQYHFNRAEEEAAHLRNITKEQILEFFDTYVRHGAPHRRKISIHILSQLDDGTKKLQQPDAEALDSVGGVSVGPPPFVQPHMIEDITKFKSLRELHPLTEPFVNISTFRV